MFFCDNALKPTNTFVFTFSTPALPSTVKIGFVQAKVDVYILNPLRCYQCQIFGNHEHKCGRQAVCANCGMPEHCPSGQCQRPARCANCSGDHPATCDANNKFIIFSDSLSVLKAMNHTSSKNPQIQKLLEKCHELLAYKEIALCWIPSHIGIQGNEMVDKQAKTSLSLEPTSFKIPFSNYKPSITKYILEEWQTSWNYSIGNKLLDIKPTIGEYQSVVRNIRKEEVVLARLRLGHTRVTHSYLLQGEEHPQCVGCDAPFTVRHFLLECGDFAQVRNNCFHVDNMKELFQDIHIDSIMTFL